MTLVYNVRAEEEMVAEMKSLLSKKDFALFTSMMALSKQTQETSDKILDLIGKAQLARAKKRKLHLRGGK